MSGRREMEHLVRITNLLTYQPIYFVRVSNIKTREAVNNISFYNSLYKCRIITS